MQINRLLFLIISLNFIQCSQVKLLNIRASEAGTVGEYEKAFKLLNKAYKLDSTYIKTYILDGVIKDHLKQYDKAISCYEKAISIEPNNPSCLVALGNTKSKIGQYDEAISLFSKALEVDSNWTDAYFNLAITQTETGDFTSAEQNFYKTQERQKDFRSKSRICSDCYKWYLAKLYMYQNKPDKALEEIHFGKNLTMQGQEDYYQLFLIHGYFLLDNKEKMNLEINRLLNNVAFIPNIIVKAKCEAYRGNKQKALQLVQGYGHEISQERRINLSIIYAISNDAENAVNELRLAYQGRLSEARITVVDYYYNSIRQTSEFQALLNDVGSNFQN